MSKPFQFKQFSIAQDRCAMKIGTDGVLLGGWSSQHKSPYSILDVGTGTGVISLMLAQRFPDAQIEAIEIDENAFEQCVQNFENSDWGDRLFCYHASFQEYFQEVDDEKYDLIISNPPFFKPHQKSGNEQRDLARFEDALPFEHLVYGASKLLDDHGTFAVVIPFTEEKQFIKLANKVHLQPQKITRVRGHKNADIVRSLIELGFEKQTPVIDELIIEIDRHVYTEAYKNLLDEFYLNLK